MTASLEEASFAPKSVPDLMFSIKTGFGVHALFLRKKDLLSVVLEAHGPPRHAKLSSQPLLGAK